MIASWSEQLGCQDKEVQCSPGQSTRCSKLGMSCRTPAWWSDDGTHGMILEWWMPEWRTSQHLYRVLERGDAVQAVVELASEGSVE